MHSRFARAQRLVVEFELLSRFLLLGLSFAAWSYALSPEAIAQAGVWRQKVENAPSEPFLASAVEPGRKAEDAFPKVAWNQSPQASWIWGAEEDSRYRLSMPFSTTAKRALLRATCDNAVQLHLNGQRVGGGDAWEETIEVDLSKVLRNGENMLEATVTNQGGIAGFVCKLALVSEDGSVQWVVSDSQWVAKKEGSDQAATVRIVAKLGDGPWGDALNRVAAPGSQPRDTFLTQPGFQVQRLFTVPRDDLGSWVALTVDPQGRLIASDQEGKGLYRITVPPLGSDGETIVEKLDLPISSAQGLLFAFGNLYLSINGGPGSGLYRASDSDADGELDKVELLKPFRGGGEHGPHALRLAPDGKSIYVICGNHTLPPEGFERSLIQPNWGEDLLLPRQWDANGHARGIMAPGGWIAKTDPDGKTWEMVSIGYRNPYDMDFNADGELFAYDADMEWDLGAPWYRPTRVVHATSGSEFGWRSGTGKWPTNYEDSLPPAVDIGPGSPVGTAFGYGAKFPGKYQRALYICDWTFGTMYAIHLQPVGSSYVGTKEEFLARTPLPLTDVVIGPDGAMYFTIGGRGTQSELFRVTYNGGESTEAVDPRDTEGLQARQLRRTLESYHGQPAKNVEEALREIWPALASNDRFIRYAARTALEFQPVEAWRSKLRDEKNPNAVIASSIALARQGNPSDLALILEKLQSLRFSNLLPEQKLAWARAMQLAFIRLGQPSEKLRMQVAAALEIEFPANDEDLNRELVQLLVFLGSEPAVAKTVTLLEVEHKGAVDDLQSLLERNRGYGGAIAAMIANLPDAQQIHYAFVLRNAKAGWTIPLREAYFRWFAKARSWSGGASYQGFLTNIDRDAYEQASDVERLAVEALGARAPFVMPERPAAIGPGKVWSVSDLTAAAGGELKGRNFENGKRAYSAASCILCHRFAGDGGATGPDLTQAAGRFGIREMAEAIIEPNRAISDQYRANRILTADGVVITGRVVSENETSYIVLTDPQDSSKIAEIAKADVEQMEPSPISLMPANLLDALNENEVLDLIAYILSRGNAEDRMFR